MQRYIYAELDISGNNGLFCSEGKRLSAEPNGPQGWKEGKDGNRIDRALPQVEVPDLLPLPT